MTHCINNERALRAQQTYFCSVYEVLHLIAQKKQESLLFQIAYPQTAQR